MTNWRKFKRRIRRRSYVGKKPESVDSLGTDGSLYGKRYVGYFADNVSWFDTASLQGQTNTTSQISSFSSSADNYSWMWMGLFRASSTGTWTFYTSSDDASYLWIGQNAISGYTTGNSVVNNGGLHGNQERSGAISLVAGEYYPIRIMFGEAGGGDIMTVSFAGPGVSKRTLGTGYYFDGFYSWDRWVNGNENAFPVSDPGIFNIQVKYRDNI